MRDAPRKDPGGSGTLSLLLRLLRWRRLILINTVGVAILAVVVSLLLPNWYEARTSLLPPQEENLSLGGLSRSLGAALAVVGGGGLSISGSMRLPMWATPSDLLAGILRSRRLRTRLIEEHDLLTVYEVENIDQALGALGGLYKVRVGAAGIVRLRVLDKEPERAAALAASAVRVLDEIQRETRHSGAAELRRFVAERMEQTTADLAGAEEALRAFQERHGLLVPEEQARALVETIAEVEAQRLAAQVERDALVAQAGATHPAIRRAEARLAALAEARAVLEGRAADGAGADSTRSALIDLGRLPDLSLRFLRLYREAEIQASLYELLVQLHEQYRILEVRDTPTVRVLDPPVVPIEKARPHRAVICVLATLLAFFASLGIAAGLERLAYLAETDPERHAQLARLLRGLGLGLLVRRRDSGK